MNQVVPGKTAPVRQVISTKHLVPNFELAFHQLVV